MVYSKSANEIELLRPTYKHLRMTDRLVCLHDDSDKWVYVVHRRGRYVVYEEPIKTIVK